MFRRSRFGLEELGRIQRNPVESHFEVQVGTGRPTSTADPADQLATEHAASQANKRSSGLRSQLTRLTASKSR